MDVDVFGIYSGALNCCLLYGLPVCGNLGSDHTTISVSPPQRACALYQGACGLHAEFSGSVSIEHLLVKKWPELGFLRS